MQCTILTTFKDASNQFLLPLNAPMHACSVASCVQLFATPWTGACQVPLTMRFSQQGHWRGLLQGIFRTQGSNPHLLQSPALAGRFFLSLKPPDKPPPTLLIWGSLYFSFLFEGYFHRIHTLLQHVKDIHPLFFLAWFLTRSLLSFFFLYRHLLWCLLRYSFFLVFNI